MTKKEKAQVKELMIRITDQLAREARIDDTDTLWSRRAQYAAADEAKTNLQADIKDLIGFYVPIA